MEVLEGSVVEGSKVKYRFTQEENSTYEISAKVEKVEKQKLLNQKGGMLLILTFNHKYILQHEKEKTRVTIHEDYRGLGVLFWNPKQVEQAYIRLNHALKKRVESFN